MSEFEQKKGEENPSSFISNKLYESAMSLDKSFRSNNKPNIEFYRSLVYEMASRLKTETPPAYFKGFIKQLLERTGSEELKEILNGMINEKQE